jgi:hypothetical protein
MVKYVLLSEIGNIEPTKVSTNTSIIFTFPLALREIRMGHFSTSHYSEVKYETNKET